MVYLRVLRAWRLFYDLMGVLKNRIRTSGVKVGMNIRIDDLMRRRVEKLYAVYTRHCIENIVK